MTRIFRRLFALFFGPRKPSGLWTPLPRKFSALALRIYKKPEDMVSFCELIEAQNFNLVETRLDSDKETATMLGELYKYGILSNRVGPAVFNGRTRQDGTVKLFFEA